MAKIQIKSEKLIPMGGIFSGYGANFYGFITTIVKFEIMATQLSAASQRVL